MIKDEPSLKDLAALWSLCCEFIEREQIDNLQACFSDSAYEEATSLLSDITDIVGFYEEPEDEDPYCTACNGTGEGQYDGSRCYSCKGSGVERREED